MNDDIEKFHAMFSGDDDDDDEPFARADGGIANYGGLDPTPLSIPSPNGLDLAPSIPVQWKKFQEQWGYLPYPDPIQEFLCNSYGLNERTLRYRWQGVGITQEPGKPPQDPMARMIGELFYGSKELHYRAERARVQSMRRRQMDLPDYMSKEEQESIRKQQIDSVLEQMSVLKDRLDKGIEVVTEQYYNPNTGTRVEEHTRPLSSVSRGRLNRDFQNYLRIYLELTNQSGKNDTVTFEKGDSFSIRENMAQTMKDMNHVFPTGHTIEELHEMRKMPQLPEVEGEIIEYEPNTTN